MTRLFVILATITAIVCFANYYFLLKQKKILVIDNIKKVEATLVENFDLTEKILVFVGNKIAIDTPDLDLKIIHKIFIQTSSIHGSNNIFSWSLFDWVNNKSYQTVNTMFGINNNPPDMSNRYYTLRGSSKWVLLFSKLVLGNPSKIPVIPVGVQIETKKHLRAGTVVLGINVRKLVNIIEVGLDKNIHFAVFDERDNRFAFGSGNAEKIFGSVFSSKVELFDVKNLATIQQMEAKYPYKILVRYDEVEFWREFFSSSLILLLQIVFTALLAVYFSRVFR